MSKNVLGTMAVAVLGIGLFAGCTAQDVTAEDCHPVYEAIDPAWQLNPDDAALETALVDTRRVVEDLPDGEIKDAVVGIADELEAYRNAEPASDASRARAGAMSDHRDALDEICRPLIDEESKRKLTEDS